MSKMTQNANRGSSVKASSAKRKPVRGLSDFERKFNKLQISAKHRASTYMKLRQYLRNGVSLPKALDTLWGIASEDGKKPKRPLAVMLDDWRKKVRDGQKFGQALKGWAPDRDQATIAAGEATGRIDVALENAIFISASEKQIKSAILGGIAYPAFLMALVFVFLFIVSDRVVPAFDSVMPRENWQGAGRSLAIASDLVNLYTVHAIIAFISLIALFAYSVPRWTGKSRVIADRFPPYSIYRLSVGSSFLLAMGGMLKAGIPIPAAMKIMRKNANNWYKERLTHTIRLVEDGKTLGEALHITGYDFPDKEAVSDLRAYSDLSGFEESLAMLGKQWMEDSVNKVKEQSAVMRIIAMVILGFVFAWIATAIFSLQQQVSSGI